MSRLVHKLYIKLFYRVLIFFFSKLNFHEYYISCVNALAKRLRINVLVSSLIMIEAECRVSKEHCVLYRIVLLQSNLTPALYRGVNGQTAGFLMVTNLIP